MIFPVHEHDDWCVHGPSVTGAALLVTLCASAFLILDWEQNVTDALQFQIKLSQGKVNVNLNPVERNVSLL